MAEPIRNKVIRGGAWSAVEKFSRSMYGHTGQDFRHPLPLGRLHPLRAFKVVAENQGMHGQVNVVTLSLVK